jgi:hypothetical protein
MNSSFVSFCLKYETELLKVSSKKDSVIDFKKSIINLPRLSSDNGILNVIILSDGSTFYLPCSVYSVSKKFNNNIIKFLSSKFDLFSSLSFT